MEPQDFASPPLSPQTPAASSDADNITHENVEASVSSPIAASPTAIPEDAPSGESSSSVASMSAASSGEVPSVHSEQSPAVPRQSPPPVQFHNVREPYAPLDATPIIPATPPHQSPLPAVASSPATRQLPAEVTPLIAGGNNAPIARPVALGILNSFLLGGLLSCALVGLGYALGRSAPNRVLVNDGGIPQTESTIISAVKAVGPAVMNVDTTFGGSTGTKEFLPSPSEMGRPQQGKGTGVVIDSKRGLMLTNAHVVAGASKIQVTTRDGQKYTGRVIGFERKNDIAVVELSSKTLPAAKLAPLKNSKDFQIGETAIAIGNPFAQANTVTVGVVSATGRTIPVPDSEQGGGFQLTEMIQTDAAINPGNSGGPLCNSKGEVIGINTAIFGIGTGLGFAIPINKAKAVAERIIKKGRAPVVKPVGFEMRTVTDATKEELGLKDKNGALVQSVAPGSPPDKAGLKPGDVVQGVDGQATNTSEAISKALNAKAAGSTARVEVLRNNAKQTLTWKVGKG